MSSPKKKTITIPASVGSNTLTDTFGKIAFTPEVKELLAALNAELNVRYVPGAEKPIISVLSVRGGDPMCSLEEFIALSGYRRFVNDAIKEVDKLTSSSAKVCLIAYFVRMAKFDTINVPERVMEQNLSKFNNIGSTLQIVERNLETINRTIDNEWRTYLLHNGLRITRILLSTQMLCMGSEIVAREHIEDQLFIAAIPKWLYTKFGDTNFTSNLKSDSKVVLFPKNNYLKAIALNTKELNNEPFMTKNQLVLSKSGGIIALSRADFSTLYPKVPSELKEQVLEYLQKYQWVCTNPSTSDEILSIRETGKSVPVFSEVTPRKKTGREQRPETELAKISRQIGNVLGNIQSTWNGIMNFVIPIANPKSDFWIHLFSNAENWEVTPTNSIYNCIRNEGSLGPLDTLRNASSIVVLGHVYKIVAQSVRVIYGSESASMLSRLFLAMHNRQDFVEREAFIDNIGIGNPIESLEGMETHPVSASEITEAKAFLGIADEVVKAKRKSGQAAVRLSEKVLKELSPLKDMPIYEPVRIWLMTSFKSNRRESLQLIAAERILGEALKHQDKIFEEGFEEEELLAMMESDDDE